MTNHFLAATESSSTNGTNGHLDGTTDGYTPTKQLDLNQDPDRLLFA
jgi:alkanesulfonate monooxygenase